MQPDCQRHLTGRGILETEAILNRQLNALQAIGHIWASPYVRAQETANLAQRVLPHLEIQTTELLTPEANPQLLANSLANSGIESVLLVSHQPLVGVFLDWLVGLEPGSQRLGTSALACIEADIIAADCGQLKWVVQP